MSKLSFASVLPDQTMVMMNCSNTSILRSSMRDKRRLTQTAVEREKQLGEQVEAKLVSEAKKTGSTDDIVRPPPTLQSVVNSIVASASPNGTGTPTNSRKVPTVAVDHRSSPEVNGGVWHAGRKVSNTSAAPAVPPRHSRVSCYPLSLILLDSATSQTRSSLLSTLLPSLRLQNQTLLS